MECRKFEITLISANELENVSRFFKMKVYARVFIGGGAAATEKRTPVDKHGKVNPAWNFTMSYTVSASMLENYNTMLVVKLYCKRMLGDRYIGEVHTSMKELFDVDRAGGNVGAMLTFPVKKGCVNSQGALRFSYKFGEKVMIDKLLMAENLARWSLC